MAVPEAACRRAAIVCRDYHEDFSEVVSVDDDDDDEDEATNI